MSNERIDSAMAEEILQGDDTDPDILQSLGLELLAELKRCYKQNDLLTKAFMMAGNNGCYMTMCEECDDVHTPDDECPFICEHCGEKKCECPASE